jgi:hypothetical protein
MKRAIALLFAFATSGVVGFGFANLVRNRAPMVTAEQLAAAHEAEEQLALAAGLAPIDHGTTSELPFEREIPLARGQCVAVVVSLAGPEHFEHVRLSLGGGRTTENEAWGIPRRLEHLAICAQADTTATLFVQPPLGISAWAPSELRYTVFRGVLAHPRTYVRLDSTSEERASFDRDAVLARLAAEPGRGLVAAMTLSRESATVQPASAPTFAALRVLTGRRATVPALDETLAAADPYRLADDRTIAPRVFAQSGLVRVIAAIDTGAIAAAHGVSCVSVLIARLDDPSVAVPITRIEVPTRLETTVAMSDPAIARDEVCTHGLFVYTTREEAGELSLSVREGQGTATAAPVASTFGLDRHGAPAPLVPMAAPPLAPARQGCLGGDAAACGQWASFAAAGLEGAGEVREALTRQCELASGDACDRLATVERDAGELRAAELHEQRACETGGEAACLRRAARLRDQGLFGEAFATYRLGCDHGSTACCSAVATMQEWQLTSG